MKKYKLIYIEWEDAISNSGWKYSDEALEWVEKETSVVKHTGWIIKETKEYILLASRMIDKSEFSGESLGQLQKIPKTWIRNRQVLKI